MLNLSYSISLSSIIYYMFILNENEMFTPIYERKTQNKSKMSNWNGAASVSLWNTGHIDLTNDVKILRRQSPIQSLFSYGFLFFLTLFFSIHFYAFSAFLCAFHLFFTFWLCFAILSISLCVCVTCKLVNFISSACKLRTHIQTPPETDMIIK